MEPNLRNPGSSFRVPSVQELAKEQPDSVPSQYIRHDQDPPIISGSSSLPVLPVIDMQSLLYGDLMESELNKLHHACQEWGFFQLINHGVRTSLVEEIKSEVQEFFKLPLEEKKKYGQEEGDIEGYGQAFLESEEQKLDWGDMFYAVTLPIHLRKPHLLPKLPLPFRNTVEAYAVELKSLAMKILTLMAKSLEMNIEDMTMLFEEGMQGMRLNYYPNCPQPELAIGIAPHSDASGLTILLEGNDKEGLQVRKDGRWIPVKPLPNAFVVNIGDALEIVTNGIYRSIEHRATLNSEKERLSVAMFYSPSMEGDVYPAPSLLSPETPPKFRRIGFPDYLKGFYSRKLDRKSNLDTLRIHS